MSKTPKTEKLYQEYLESREEYDSHDDAHQRWMEILWDFARSLESSSEVSSTDFLSLISAGEWLTSLVADHGQKCVCGACCATAKLEPLIHLMRSYDAKEEVKKAADRVRQTSEIMRDNVELSNRANQKT